MGVSFYVSLGTLMWTYDFFCDCSRQQEEVFGLFSKEILDNKKSKSFGLPITKSVKILAVLCHNWLIMIVG